jgi:hypothetical protein
MRINLAASLLALMGLALAQGPIPQRGQQIPKPSSLMAAPVAAQTVTLTIPLTSDLATAIEKHRRDTYKAVVNDATQAVTLQPVNPDLASQILAALRAGYFRQVLTQYPPASVDVAQKARAAQDKAIQDALDNAVK